MISFFQEYRFFCAVPFYNLFAALRVIHSRCPSDLFIKFLHLFKWPAVAVRTKMKRVLVFQVLVFRVLGLSFPDTQFPYITVQNNN